MAEEKSEKSYLFGILAIVAIVAVVGLVVLFSGIGAKTAVVKSAELATAGASEAANVGGQAIKTNMSSGNLSLRGKFTKNSYTLAPNEKLSRDEAGNLIITVTQITPQGIVIEKNYLGVCDGSCTISGTSQSGFSCSGTCDCANVEVSVSQTGFISISCPCESSCTAPEGCNVEPGCTLLMSK